VLDHREELIHKHDNGFTLIELILVTVVAGIVGSFTVASLYTNFWAYQTLRDQAELQREASYVLERVTRDLRDAHYVPAGACRNGYLAFGRPDRGSGETVAAYTVSGQVLYRTSMINWATPLGNPKLMSRHVGSFSCALDNPSPGDEQTYQITITMIKLGSQPFTLSTKVCPRNYCGGTNTGACSIAYGDTTRSFNRHYFDAAIQ